MVGHGSDGAELLQMVRGAILVGHLDVLTAPRQCRWPLKGGHVIKGVDGESPKI
jgi:hypothetical protein